MTAIAVAVMIGKTAWDIFSDAAHSLTDADIAEQIERRLLGRHQVRRTYVHIAPYD